MGTEKPMHIDNTDELDTLLLRKMEREVLLETVYDE